MIQVESICRRLILNASFIAIFLFGLVENIVGKGENAGNQHFLHFQQCFQKVSISVDEIRDCVIKE